MRADRISIFKHKLRDFIKENGKDINVYEMIRILHDVRNEVEECAMKATVASTCIGIIDSQAGLRKESGLW